jgi:nicotinamidase-related amidase
MSDHPKTLLEMAGAKAGLPDMDNCVLLLIDFQRQYLQAPTVLAGAKEAVAVAAGLVNRCRAEGVPVVHVFHQGRAGGMFDLEGESGKIIAPLVVGDSDAVVHKQLPNSFAATKLQEVLKATGRLQLIVAGFMTHMCVSSTVRAGLDLGWQSFVVGDACASRDLPDPTRQGEVISAADLHRSALAGLADRFATIVSGDEIM